MDWRALARGVLLYGVGAAGLTVLVVALVTSGEFPLFALMVGGLVCLLFAFGISDVRTNQDFDGGAHEMELPRVGATVRQRLSTDWLLACYGVVLAVLSFAAMVLVGG
ncbi:MAG: hypothetical protein ACOCSD_01440 [Halolamina sp.]